MANHPAQGHSHQSTLQTQDNSTPETILSTGFPCAASLLQAQVLAGHVALMVRDGDPLFWF
ncbi:MAG: hypothetical protein HQM04_11325 [Magnetococcales bacterium]|nr:hypothetical protein [Magnetococcales bacterium]MBF0115615.1 hypothetical protein [Magnetococcales bacterium]